MPGLYVLAAILCLLIAISLLRIRISLTYTEKIAVDLRILFLRFRLYPKKKRIKVKRYTYRRYRKRLLAQRKKERERAKKQAQPTPKKASKKRPFKQSMRLYTYLFKKLYIRILHHFRIDVAKLHVIVATGDAAQTAIATGIASQAVAYILQLLQDHAKFHRAYRSSVVVAPDFLAENSRIACNVTFSLRVYEIIDLGIRFFYHFLIERMNHHNFSSNKEEKPWQKAN